MAIRSQQGATYTKPMSKTEMKMDYAMVIRHAYRNALARRET